MENDKLYPWVDNYPENITWNKKYEEEPLYNLIDKAKEKYKNLPAVDFMGKKWSWSEIAILSDKMAKGLQNMGVGKGSKIGICLPNTPYFIIAYYAIAKIGAVIVNYNPLYAERELANQIEDSETDIMITVNLSIIYDKIHKMLSSTRLNHIIVCDFIEILPFPKNILFKSFKFRDISSVKEGKRHSWFHNIVDNDGNYKKVEINPAEDVVLFQYTGGTTGIPKAAMLTHKNIVTNAKQAYDWCMDGYVAENQEKMLNIIPLFHVFAMTAVMNMSVIAGFEIICMPKFDLKDTLKIIDKKKPNLFPAVPAILSAINSYPDIHKYNLSSLRFCISGGAPLPVEVKKSFEEKTGCIVVEGYGLTESSPVVCVNPVSKENKAGSIGMPLPDTIIEIIDREDGVTVLPIGREGEICISGPQVMKGYWNNDEATKKTIINGRLHTGDIGKIDEDGYVYVIDRMKDMIITNGYNVYPRNVEEAIYLHPSVEECIVAGIPDKARGEIVKAWIKLKEGRKLPIEDIKEFLKDKISPMEIPKRFEFRDEALPKTMIGKLSRKDILEEEKNKS